MALQGNLGAFALPDVLRLLATTRKTGCLYVEGDRGRGSVWLDEGGVVAATAGRALNAVPVDEAMFELLRHRRGSFRFSLDEAPPLETVQALDLESTLLRALQLLDEWRELEAVVPTLSHRVELVPELAVGHVTIDSGRWATLAAVADGISVGKLAESLGMGEIDVSRAVRDLVDMGVVRVGPPAGSQPQPAPSRLDSGRTPVTAGVGVGAGASRGNGADHHSPISAQVVTRPRTGPMPAIDDLDV